MQRLLKNSEAIVLKKINFRDADRIYTLLTKENGKVSALAKGVRKITSKRSGNLDTLNHIVVSFAESTSGHKIITEVKTINTFKNIKASLDLSQIGYYFAELVNKSVEEDSESFQIFTLLCDYLEMLEKGDQKPGFVMNKFEVMLMKTLGYEIGLEKLRSFGKEYMNERLKAYIRETLDEDFKSLEL